MTTERLTISFDPEKGELVITDGRMMSSLGTLVPVMTMSGPADKREELVARFNAARGQWGLPPLPDPRPAYEAASVRCADLVVL